jgi:hypothetical protein
MHLVAYEGRVQAASTWPFDVGTYLRFGFCVTVGLGSWLGAALVECALGMALD